MRPLKKVMLVEDDLDIALLARIALEEFGGLELTHHASGMEALAGLETEQPDLVILDYRMPGMNGAEVFAEIRKSQTWGDVPVIFMTASLMPKHVERLRDLGALDVLPKPFDPLTLAERVQRIWSQAFAVRAKT